MHTSHEQFSSPSPPESVEDRVAAAENGEPLFATKFPLSILIADDNYISRRTLILLLQNLGYKVDSAENGQECLNAATKKTYALIFMDIDMPIMDGIECTRAIRDAKIATAIVAVTAIPPQVARMESMGAGMNGYIEKPVKMDALKQALRLAYLSRAVARAA
jgi:two-component system sensor histidine kinase/response regulator